MCQVLQLTALPLRQLSSTSGCKKKQKGGSTNLCRRNWRYILGAGIRRGAGVFGASCTPKNIHDISVTCFDMFVCIFCFPPPISFCSFAAVPFGFVLDKDRSLLIILLAEGGGPGL
jgi:hypothetical protein